MGTGKQSSLAHLAWLTSYSWPDLYHGSPSPHRFLCGHQLTQSSQKSVGCFRHLHSGWLSYFFILMSPTFLTVTPSLESFWMWVEPISSSTVVFHCSRMSFMISCQVVSWEILLHCEGAWLAHDAGLFPGDFLSEGVAGTRSSVQNLS